MSSVEALRPGHGTGNAGRYADEVHKAQGYFRDIGDAKPEPELLELAEALIEKKSGDFYRDLPRPLRRRAEGPDRAQAQGEDGAQDHRGQG
ncbi:hypothetical protein AB5I41_06030 [Sphingomonas sp. MMS24-JH45]